MTDQISIELPKQNLNPPKVIYEPHYVYGYRGYDSKNNLFFTASNNLVYPMGSMGIIMNPIKNTQIFFGEVSKATVAQFLSVFALYADM